MKSLYLFSLALLVSTLSFAQGLEDVIVETYYVSDANDAADQDGGDTPLPEGSVTYRIYVDMAEGYEIQAVYGNSDHEMRIETTSLFWNNEDRGESTGDQLPTIRLDENTVALDSYLTLGAASDQHFGIPKNLDTDGSIVGGDNNDGGSEGVDGGLLVNLTPEMGLALTESDGLIEGTLSSDVLGVGISFDVFADVPVGNSFVTGGGQDSGGAWSVLEGVQGPTDENIVLIAQITTDGDLSFKLNLQLGTPDGETEQYVSSLPMLDGEQFWNQLCFPTPIVDGCTSQTACNYNPQATNDDGSCLEPDADCEECVDEMPVIIDENDNGTPDCEEGCTSETACNYNQEATLDDDSCLEPEENCSECDGLELIVIDTDEDGICDADEISGCTSETACNYNPEATDEDDSCLEPDECFACNEDNTELVLIDENNNGLCDAQEDCNDQEACNYNPEATTADDCLYAVENCVECNDNGGLTLIDDDEDGVANCDEILGCTNIEACNYDIEATEEDDSCVLPVEDCIECDGEGGFTFTDINENEVPDCEEISGCTDETACNYNSEATLEDESCVFPVEDCITCDGEGGFTFVDENENGVPDCEDIDGCTSETACNYNPEATADDGSCIEPEENCTECDGEELVLIDEDEDGVCDEEDICNEVDDADYVDVLTDLNNDGEIDCEDVDIYDSVVEIDNSISVSFYPNPVNDQITINVSGIQSEKVSMTIKSILGQEISSTELISSGNSVSETISMIEEASGVYFITVISNDNQSTFKFIKE